MENGMIRNLADQILKFFCRPEFYPDIKGDLDELFHDRSRNISTDLRYLWEVLLLLRPSLMRNFFGVFSSFTPSNQLSMIKNYLLVAFRQIRRNSSYSFINISGFSLGIASCILIFFYVKNETSFDQFHSQKEQIYKVTTHASRASGDSRYSETPPALGPVMVDELPDIARQVRMRATDERLFATNDRKFYERHGFFVDSTFLDIFDFPLLSGDPITALDQPNTIIISEDLAYKYFGDSPAVGQQIIMDNRQNLKVTGVFRNVPPNSHIQFDYMLSFTSLIIPEGYLANLESWTWIGFETYILTEPATSVSQLEEKMSKIFDENLKSRTGIKISAILQPLTEIYLESEGIGGAGNDILFLKGDKRIIKGLAAIAILILIIACINFMNLSTAMSLKRGREVGVRKSLGAVRGKLIFQFIIESVVLGLLSLGLAFLMLMAGHQLILQNLELPMQLDPVTLMQYLPWFVGGVLLVSILAGIYPSLVMSGFDPIVALKGKLNSVGSGAWFQKSLIVFQFTISLCLIAGSMVVIYQLNFMQNQSLGYDKERILTLRMPSNEVGLHAEQLIDDLYTLPEVLNVTNHNNIINGNTASFPIRLKEQQEEEAFQMDYHGADYDFLKTLNIRLVEGRYFSKDILTDSADAIVLNESAVKTLGITDPIGQEVVFINQEPRKIIGVIEDFHFLSLHKEIGPLALVIPFTNIEAFMVKLAPGSIDDQIAGIEQSWRRVVPHLPFDYSFLDSHLSAMYDKEKKLGKLIPVFSGLAVFLACLGLYGLVALNMQNRLKEIGIRKVLGSSIQNIMILLSRQYMIIVIISIAIAWPLTWYFAKVWLSDFAYHVEAEWWIFLSSGLILVLIALATISRQLIKAATENPVEILKTE